MKKQIKTLSFMAALCLLSGVATVNTASAETNEPTNVFTMDVGASVRVPDVTNTDVTTNDNGLRFKAFMSKDKYSETADYGTFIMPLSYYTANPVTAETLAANYYWKTGEDEEGNAVYNTTETDGKKQIINVEAKAYLDEVDYNNDEVEEEMYVINGSVLHVRGENLNLEYIGVSYAKEGEEYTFATQTIENARSVVEVAQKALLNADNDKAFVDSETGTKAEKVAAVDGAYTARYVSEYQAANEGAYPMIEVNVRVLKDVSSTSGYVAEDTVAKVEVPFTGYNATTTGEVQERDGYTYVSLKTEPVTVMLDGSTAEVQQYFDYTANDIVLWDGDENVADTTFGKTQYWNMVDRDPTSGDYVELAVEGETIYSGKSLLIKNTMASWDGPVWKNGFSVAASKFSMIIDAPAAGEIKMQAWALKNDGSKGWLGGEYYVKEDGNYDWANEDQIISVTKGVQKVTVDFGETAKLIYGFSFVTRLAGHYSYSIDNICAEIEYGLEEGYMPTAFGYTKGQRASDTFSVTASDNISFKAPVLKSSVYFPEELANNPISMYYKNDAETTEYTLLSATEDVYTITVPENSTATTYTLKAETKDGAYSKEYVLKKGVEYSNFEFAVQSTDWAITNNTYGAGGWGTTASNSGSVIVPNWYEYRVSHGAYVAKTATGPSYITNRSNMTLPFECKKIGLWIADGAARSATEQLSYTGKTITLTQWQFRSNGAWILSANSSVVVDESAKYIEIDFKSAFTVFDVGSLYYVANQVNIDSIVFLA